MPTRRMPRRLATVRYERLLPLPVNQAAPYSCRPVASDCGLQVARANGPGCEVSLESLPVSDELHGVVARQEEEQRRRLVAAITPLSTDPIPAANVVHEVAIGTQTPQSVSLTLAVGVEHLAAVA